MDDPVTTVLSGLGLSVGGGVVANTLYGIIKSAMENRRDVAGTALAIQNEFNSSGINMDANIVIEKLVNNGVINITVAGTITPST